MWRLIFFIIRFFNLPIIGLIFKPNRNCTKPFYLHRIEWKLSVNFKLICYISSSACEYQYIRELGKNEVIVMIGKQELLNPIWCCILLYTVLYGVLPNFFTLLTKKNIRAWEPLREIFLKHPSLTNCWKETNNFIKNLRPCLSTQNIGFHINETAVTADVHWTQSARKTERTEVPADAE